MKRVLLSEARYVVLGQYPRATGCIRVCQLCHCHALQAEFWQMSLGCWVKAHGSL